MENKSESCGCKCHPLDPNIKYVLFNEIKWHPLCALKESIRLLGETQEKLKETEELLEVSRIHYDLLLENVKALPCDSCYAVMGSDWGFHDGAPICNNCTGKNSDSLHY